MTLPSADIRSKVGRSTKWYSLPSFSFSRMGRVVYMTSGVRARLPIIAVYRLSLPEELFPIMQNILFIRDLLKCVRYYYSRFADKIQVRQT